MSPSDVHTTYRTPTEEVDDSPQLLYRPLAQQLTPESIPFTMRPVYVTPEEAAEFLFEADNYEGFRPRKRTEARKRHWVSLMETGRFVEFSPEGALCFNPDGICLNGGNRLGAVVEYGKPVGFLRFDNVPDWMSKFFDQGDKRSLAEQMFMNKKDLKPGTTQTVRLGMRFEEFIMGKRSPYGWIDWGRHKDLHSDIDNWIDRRSYVLEYVAEGGRVRKFTQIQQASAVVFMAYQQMAWPQGTEAIEEFLEGMMHGTMLARGNPALTLREWLRSDGFIGHGTHGRREGHLLLMFRHFEAFVQKINMPSVKWAKGMPMAMPFHPKGDKTAVSNIVKAMTKMDAGQ